MTTSTKKKEICPFFPNTEALLCTEQTNNIEEEDGNIVLFSPICAVPFFIPNTQEKEVK